MIIKNKKYLEFYDKDFGHLTKAFKLSNDICIDEAVKGTLSMHAFRRHTNDVCVFNPFSLTNVMRRLEHHVAWVSEAEQKTENTDKFISKMFSFYRKIFASSALCLDSIEEDNDVECLHPNSDKSIYGKVQFKFMLDLTKHDAEHYVKVLTRYAHIMNYNMLDFEYSKPEIFKYKGENVKCSLLIIWFEAAYQDKVSINAKQYAYHVTPSSIAKKILKNGLMPRNNNSFGLRYPDRVYLFVDTENIEAYAATYSMMSKKLNKKFISKQQLDTMSTDEIAKLVELSKNECGILINDKKFTILQIDLAKAGNVKLYVDYQTLFDKKFVAAYTYQAIPTKAIVCYKNFVLK